MDFFDLTEKRHDAAQTLVVPYDATPDAVDAAYNRRMAQRIELQNVDLTTFMRGSDALYDARVRMRLPENKQWLAQLRLLMTGPIDKSHVALLTLFKYLRDKKYKSKFGRAIADEMISDTRKLCRRYNVLRGVCFYSVACVWGSIAYDKLATDPNPFVSIGILGSCVVVTSIGIPAASFMMRRKIRDVVMNFTLLHEIIGPQDTELYELDQEIAKDLTAMEEMHQEFDAKYQKRYDDMSNAIKEMLNKQK